ncbi:hypothetical protein MIND_00607100 [Mycena indigotica]|uniref:Microtubule associated protein n=1 Tax=Mycena indigotica TaxID=2126181 RepID=A0A8H6STR3_9AGAR|nr:uncharacterized protein MIND_00607100 [Mycena indigotica]KAF7303775.1 hypothetical protein MIND_00607100 [Mycena indigotica]
MATFTNLLNTLQSALSSELQLLPTLNAQLGRPAALEDDISSLQDQLVRCVEACVEERRKEVDNWMGKCELVEQQCVNYTKALGGNIKATGSSLGELRKQQVLPVRYDMVSEYQEKLRQLYHTKLEQLTSLCNRLSTLTRTLGASFYTDIIDEGEYRDVSPERFSRLEKELVRGKAEVTKRLAHLGETFVQIDWLYTELGMVVPDLPDEDEDEPATGSRSRSSSGSDPFHTPSATDASRYRLLAEFIEQSNSLPEDSPPRLEVEPTHELITWAMDLRASLEDMKRRRETHIQAMYDQLEGLWRRLGVADADMDAFVEAHRGSTDETVAEYEEELERMLELKRERMGTFVQSAREEIAKLWDELMVGDEERKDWFPFFDDEHTEDLLTTHEDEIKRLKEEKRVKAPLLASIKRYFDICEEEKELAAAASDQTRLLGRGPRDPGRLLREEKMRKRVSKEKPRLEQDLLTTIPAWEQDTGRPFLVHGQSILQLLLETVGGAEQENLGPQGAKRKPSPAGRATSVPPRATTPTQSYAPKTGTVTPAVRPMPATSNSLPNKRARTETTPNYGVSKPAPLGTHRGNNGVQRSASPSKIPGPLSRMPITKPPMLGLPRPAQAQHQALGHGRGPTVGYSGIRSASLSISTSTSSSISTGRYASGGALVAQHSANTLAVKAARARRESFKPRASVDAEAQRDIGLSHVRWGLEGAVKEEDEDY